MVPTLRNILQLDVECVATKTNFTIHSYSHDDFHSFWALSLKYLCMHIHTVQLDAVHNHDISYGYHIIMYACQLTGQLRGMG